MSAKRAERGGAVEVLEPSGLEPGIGLAERYGRVRAATDWLAAPLSPEDATVQAMPDASPAKWHLAHTTWFFETFILERARAGFRAFHPDFRVLFNSYYNSLGAQHPRAERGLVTRPGLAEVRAYRAHVDREMSALLDGGDVAPELAALVEIGLQHEQQHQELILTDLKFLLSRNPLRPIYRERPAERPAPAARPLAWRRFEGGVRSIGFAGPGFAFDNEGPRHRVYLEPFELGSRLVTTGEYLAFMADGGYRRPELWLADGWTEVHARDLAAPLYWNQGEPENGRPRAFTLAGERDLDPAEPVCHLSYYEADAYARWAGARLPTEAEWETAATAEPAEIAGNLVETARLHPAPAAPEADRIAQLYGDVWEWTASPYVAYPGYRPPAGALGEYNGKFMCNQLVLRGGSCATPASHIRATYRNFFPPAARWQFSGIRLARDAS
ncbi:MAG TPA: ergothioneine biosynthesis protein EgtB [Thermoanaerobaculia bacterium]|jgi:ergothioneine biosynthesis protein EgtB